MFFLIFLFFCKFFIYNSITFLFKTNKKSIAIFSNTFYIQSFYILSNLFIDSVSPTSTTISVSLNLYSGSGEIFTLPPLLLFIATIFTLYFLRTDNSIMLLPIHVFGTTASTILYSSDNSIISNNLSETSSIAALTPASCSGIITLSAPDFFQYGFVHIILCFTDNLLNSHIF